MFHSYIAHCNAYHLKTFKLIQAASGNAILEMKAHSVSLKKIRKSHLAQACLPRSTHLKNFLARIEFVKIIFHIVVIRPGMGSLLHLLRQRLTLD